MKNEEQRKNTVLEALIPLKSIGILFTCLPVDLNEIDQNHALFCRNQKIDCGIDEEESYEVAVETCTHYILKEVHADLIRNKEDSTAFICTSIRGTELFLLTSYTSELSTSLEVLPCLNI
jgi:hypothetical protein